MEFDLILKNVDLTIYCSNGLKSFSNEFINYYNDNIEHIKKELAIDEKFKIIVALTDDENQVDFVYCKSSFSGFFTETGSFAYINLNGNKTKDYMFKGLMHELIHHLYKYYVYGADKERITWVDEGLAQFLSGQKEELQSDTKYHLFVEENLKYIDNIDLNKLNHNDRSFGNYNGYNLSYIAIRYLYDNNSHENFINIIKSKEQLLDYGNKILKSIKKNYSGNNKTI